MDVKKNDSPTLAWDAGSALTGYTSARFIAVHRVTTTTKILKAATINGSTLSVTLLAADTAVLGEYNVEFELLPGPMTWPSSGYARLTIHADLD